MSQYLPFSPGHHLVLSCEQILSPLMERGPCCTPIISATHQRNDFPLGLEISSELLWFHLTLLTCERQLFHGSGAGFQGNDLPPGS